MGKCKCKREPAAVGVPEWVVTYGDMMSLLLCFFILLAAFSELKKEHEYQQVVTAVQEAFGVTGGAGVLPVDDIPARSMLKKLQELLSERSASIKPAENTEKNIAGDHTRVTRIRDGLMFTLGSSDTFDPESAELKPDVREELRAIAELMKGRNNRIVVRGHTDPKILTADSPWSDLYDLSYARAHAVVRFLIDEAGLEPTRIRAEACGDTEPILARATGPESQRVNRRVEVILLETLVEDINPDAHFTDPDNAKGG